MEEGSVKYLTEFIKLNLDCNMRHKGHSESLNIRSLEVTSDSAMAERPRELVDFKKARVNGGTNNHCLKDSHTCLRCR